MLKILIRVVPTVNHRQKGFPNLVYNQNYLGKLKNWIPGSHLRSNESVSLRVHRPVFAVLKVSREGTEVGKGLTDWGKLGHELEHLTDDEEHGSPEVRKGQITGTEILCRAILTKRPGHRWLMKSKGDNGTWSARGVG